MADIERWMADCWLPAHCTLGESPTYRASDNTFFFVDIDQYKLHYVDVDEGWSSLRSIAFDQEITCINLVRHDTQKLAVTMKLGFAILDLVTQDLKWIKHVHNGGHSADARGSQVRFNDGDIDVRSRWWAGTMHHEQSKEVGALWRLDDRKLTEVIPGSICPNGMGWSPDEKIMYWTETALATIYKFDFNEETGDISGKRVFAKLEKGMPDGLAVDETGAIWTAANGIGKVLRFSPSGLLVGEVIVPGAKLISCPCFGGRNMDEIFVTCLRDKENPSESTGDVYRCKVGIKGRSKHEYCLS